MSLPEQARDARRLLRPLRRDLTTLLQELIRVDTVAIPPKGNETPGQQVLCDFLKAHGVKAEMYDTAFVAKSGHAWARTDRNYRGRKNLVARLAGNGRGKSLLLNGHMDTVPAGVGVWRDGAWSGKLRGGRMYGRGGFDMKGGVVAHFGVACALRRAGVTLGGDLLCESVVDEEWGGGGGSLAARLRGDTADACAITEGTQLAVALATRGGFVVDLETEAGDAASYFSTHEVESPAIPLGRLLGWVDQWVAKRRKVPRGKAYAAFADPAPVQVLAIEANRFDPDVPLSVPLRAGLRVYFQFLPHEDVAKVLKEIRTSLDRFAQTDPFFRAHPVTWKPMYDPSLLGHELSPDHPWSRVMIDAATAVLGEPPTVSATPYPCDAFLMHREFGIPTLLFGPCGAGAHNVDEYVELESVIQTAETLLAAAFNWCGI